MISKNEHNADTVAMDENVLEAVIDLLWQEFDPFLPDGAVHPHVMRAIAYRLVEAANASLTGVAALIDGPERQ